MNEKINRTLRLLPDRPGVYIMKNSGGQIIYVGKAKNLANRVRSYFHSPGGLNAKTRALVESVEDISYIVADSELEALLLENNLIKKNKPYYNILLKDDKGYPYLRLNTADAYPALTVARRLVHDGALYFGPFFGAGLARDIAEAVISEYPLRSCNLDINARKGKIRPCVRYEIGKCAGPCREEYKKEDYNGLVRGVKQLFDSGYNGIKALFENKMYAASERMDYEKAAQYRDRAAQLDRLDRSQKAVLPKKCDLDAVTLTLSQGYAVFVCIAVRAGRLISVHTDEFPDTAAAEEELREQYLLQRYAKEEIPREILLDGPCPSQEAVQEHLRRLSGRAVSLHVPQRGDKAAIVRLGQENGRETMEKSLRAELARRERVIKGLTELKSILHLPGLPRRIECYDISHIQGTDTVASMVVLTDGVPQPRQYRRFKIRSVEGNNDFASMAEVVRRRFSRLKTDETGDSFDVIPDLVVIDGGKGQLSSACGVLDELGLHLDVIGLAKRLEEIYLPGCSEPVVPGTESLAVQLLQTVRDEAHRFAITYHRALRSKRSLLSVLDSVAGVGARRKQLLFAKYGSVSAISRASKEELAALPGMNAAAAASVYDFFAARSAQEQTKQQGMMQYSDDPNEAPCEETDGGGA